MGAVPGRIRVGPVGPRRLGRWLALAALLLLVGCTPGVPPGPARIVLITVDTLRADHLGCYGSRSARTPHLDTLAASGVRFEAAVSPVPLTLPAHASLMTGVDPPQHGVRHNSIHRLGPELPTLAERLRERGYATAAFVGALVLDRRFGLDRGFEVYDDRTAARVSGATGYAERRADAVVDAALAWLDDAPERFLLWVHFYDPHVAYDPPPGFAAAFAGDRYAGEIAFVDSEIGRLLAAVDARHDPSGTLVVATSDHGESRGEHGEPTHSYSLYEATQRIPLLLAGAGLPRGLVAPAPVGLIDLAPTLVAWVGALPLPEATGHDLRVAMREGGPGNRALYMETLATRIDFGWSALQALRLGRYKLVRAPRPELYDLVADPDELRDLAGDEPARVAQLEARLAAWSAGQREPAGVRVPAEDRDRLRALGYVVPESPASVAEASRIAGPDPKDRMAMLGELARAADALAEGRAEEALTRLDALDDGGTRLGMQRAAAALAAGRAARAEREARAVLALEPGRSDARILVARALDAAGRRGEADAVLAGLPPDVAPAAWVARRAARAELRDGAADAAERRLAAARLRHPGDARLAQLHAQALGALGREDAARAARESAAALGEAP